MNSEGEKKKKTGGGLKRESMKKNKNNIYKGRSKVNRRLRGSGE